MSTERRPSDIEEVLEFLSPRLREILRRLAKRDRRDPLQELAFIIEDYAEGELVRRGDKPAIPRVSLTDLPEVQLVESVRVRRVRPPNAEIDQPQPAKDIGE